MYLRFHAVITGDIVGSEGLDPAERQLLEAVFARASDALRERFGLDRIPYPIDRFRGDSWQLLAVTPEISLRVALYIRAAVRAARERPILDTRLAIGLGTVDFLPDEDVSSGDGEAFRNSGRALDALRGRRMDLRLPGEPAPGGRSLRVIVHLLDTLGSRWTARQARAVQGALLGQTQEQIGEDWAGDTISQQAVGQHLARAGWDSVGEAVEHFEELVAGRAREATEDGREGATITPDKLAEL